MWDIFGYMNPYSTGIKFNLKPKCTKCLYRKLGLTTICEQYKRIPSDIQKGNRCGKYAEKEVK